MGLHGAEDAEPGVAVDEPPDGSIVSSVDASKINSASVTILTGTSASSMHRVAHASLEPGGNGLTVVVSEPAEDRPPQATCIECSTQSFKLRPERWIDAANDVLLDGHAPALGGLAVLPTKDAGVVLLGTGALVDGPEV
ncbi:MAG: hypothetical protein J2P54_07175 [Bradyrhizobiaceae bacterium]|nr:hypothetical protein [Bradyrhizobiaceae bacterium]